MIHLNHLKWRFTQKKASFTLLFAVCFLCVCSPIQAETLKNAVDTALQSYPDILRALSEQKATAYEIRQVQGQWLPALDVDAAIGHENTDNPATRGLGKGDVNFTRKESAFILQQLLFDGGNVNNQIKEAKANYRTRTFEVDEVKQDVGFLAAQAYLNVLRERELLAIREFDIKAHRTLYGKVAKRLEAGAGKKSELQLADSRLALAESRFAEAQGNLYSANDTYTKIMGTAPNTKMALPNIPSNLPHTLQNAQHLAMMINPSIHATDQRILANEASVGIARAAYFPIFTIDLSQTFNDNLDGIQGYNNQRNEMLRMRYNLFNGGSDKAQMDAAHSRVTAAQHDSATIRRNVNERVALAWDQLQASINKLPALETHVTQSYNVWQAYEKQFQLGQRTLFDLLNSQAEYYNARSALTDAQYDVRVNRFELLAAMGNFVAFIEKNQGTPDPYANILSPSREFPLYTNQTLSENKGGILSLSSNLAKQSKSSPAIPDKKLNYSYSVPQHSMPPADPTAKANRATRKSLLKEAKTQYGKQKPNNAAAQGGLDTREETLKTIPSTPQPASIPTATENNSAGLPSTTSKAVSLPAQSGNNVTTQTTHSTQVPTTQHTAPNTLPTNPQSASKPAIIQTKPTVLHQRTSIPPTSNKMYTIQLFSAQHPDALQQLAKNLHLQKFSLRKSVKNKQTWFVLTTGKYAHISEAKTAIHALSPNIQKLHPYIRTINSYTKNA